MLNNILKLLRLKKCLGCNQYGWNRITIRRHPICRKCTIEVFERLLQQDQKLKDDILIQFFYPIVKDPNRLPN